MNRFLEIYGFQIISWIFAYTVFGISVYFLLLNIEESFRSEMPLHFWRGILTSILSGTNVGLVLGTIDRVIERRGKKMHSFLRMFLVKTASYILAFTTLVFITAFLIQRFHLGHSTLKSLEEISHAFEQNIMVAYFIYTLSFSIVVSLFGQLRRMIGTEIFLPLFFGKYYRPRVEERIFMFLDLKSSTAIAEKLGHIRYSQLIQDCFYDLNREIRQYKAQIYQYVGDEAVLTWTPKLGIAQNNCIFLFHAFSHRLKTRSPYYQETYGVVPQFKAGLHMGNVTAAEVGDLKKEIAYHGDVLNTTARLQEACNTYQCSLLTTQKMANLLLPEPRWEKESLGSLQLKGKQQIVEVFSISMAA